MPGSFRIGRVAGVEIRLHFSFLLVLPFLAILFSRAFDAFREGALGAGIPPGLVRGPPLAWGAVLAVALFVSVIVHELAHSLYAIRKGGTVKHITLLMIGGVSSIVEPPRGRHAEAVMALVGPLASLGLAGALFGAHLLLAGTSVFSLRFAVFYLAAMNLALGIFNLLPAFPMDGGRILRGLLATRMGMSRATSIAATIGKAAAALFVVAGILSLNFLLALVGMFVWLGAESESRQVRAQAALAGTRAGDLARPPPQPLAPSSSVQEAAARMLDERRTALLAMDGAHLLGVVALEDVEKVPTARRGAVALLDIVRPAPQVASAASAWDAFRLLAERRLPLLPIVDDGRVIGVLEQDDLVRALRLERLGREGSPWMRERTA